ncbi:hypothetical protein B0H66DRAFT_59588 [Apodospora peruviana]|uniref:Uncharacterized protein n=1 Tax=Apodospora peruviana TaxID=516989 RepID=A0AAE0MGR2_9PEZI|nr:hypothetical protein B0H66DRAFT_59588 [Apodospora peruviana]
MGNLCGKASNDDPFAQPGRRLDSAPPAPKSASVPAKVVGGPPRTLGGGSGSGSGGATTTGVGVDEARRKAAEAAEARAKQGGGGGKLSSQLAAQKRQTRTDTLKEVSDTQRRQRDMDASADALNHN